MKDLKGLLIYGTAAGLVILLLSTLAARQQLSGGSMVMLALILVVILPIAISINAARREHQREKDKASQD